MVGLPLMVMSLLLQAPGAPQAVGAVTPEQRDEAIRKGFECLDAKVWGLNEGGSPQKQYTIALVAWASLLAGDHEGDSKRLPSRSKEIEKLRSYLERYVGVVAHEYEKADEKARKKGDDAKKPPSEEPNDLSAAFTRPSQYVWPVSMAAHYFAESYARGRDKADAKQGLKDAIAVLEAAQQKDGGWGHDDAARPGMGLPPIRIPKPGGGELEYPATLLAASNCALSALGVAHARLGTKASESLSRGIGYFRSAQNADGTFPYDPAQRHELAGSSTEMMGGIEVARTPAAFFALGCAGPHLAGKELRLAAQAMDQSPESWCEGHGSASMALQFAALAARARGDASWAAFRRLYFPRILAHQQEDGSFTCIAEAKTPGVTVDTEPLGDLPGMGDWVAQQKVYVTGIHVLVLLLDRSRLAAIPPLVTPVATATTGAK
jgi:hypothetical protein